MPRAGRSDASTHGLCPGGAPAPCPAGAATCGARRTGGGAANTVLTNAANAASPAQSQPIVIDPLVDGTTGAQSRAMDSIQTQIVGLVHDRHP
jgi:hypothetical protein